MASYQEYFRDKQVKLDAQFESSRALTSNIFAGVVAAVDGFTEELSALEIKQILAKHGGTYAQYVWSPGITHLIASNLPTAKVRKELSVKRRTPLAIVTPKWIVDCLKAKKQIPWDDYVLAQLHSPEQTTLNKWRGASASAATTSSSLSSSVVIDISTPTSVGRLQYQLVVKLNEDAYVIGAARRLSIDLERTQLLVLSEDTNGVVVAISAGHHDGQIRVGWPLPPNQLEEPNIRIVSYNPGDVDTIASDFFRSVRNALPLSYHMEMVSSTEIRVGVDDVEPDPAIVSDLERAIKHTFPGSQPTVHVLRSALESWAREAGTTPSRVDDLRCVPFDICSRLPSNTTLEDAAIALIAIEGERERFLRQVCSGSVVREVNRQNADDDLIGQEKDAFPLASKRDVVLTAQIRLDGQGDAQSISSELTKRILSRSRADQLFTPSTSDVTQQEGILITVKHLPLPNKASSVVISAGDLLQETIALVREVLSNSSSFSFTGSSWIRLSVSRCASSSSLNPATFSQISPQVLKQLPREIVLELKSELGRKNERNEESSRRTVPETYSQLDTETLHELPDDIRREIEQSFRPTPPKHDVPTLPRSFSQVDSKIFAELPLDVQLAVKRELRPASSSSAAVSITERVMVAEEEEDENSRASWPESFSQIDLETLRELPADVAREVEWQLKSKKSFRSSRAVAIDPSQSKQPKGIRGFAKRAPPSSQPPIMASSISNKQVRFSDVIEVDDEPTPSADIRKRSASASTQVVAGLMRLMHEPFPKIRQVVTDWFLKLDRCPHQQDIFQKCCTEYVESLFQVKELDTVVSLFSLLKRLCSARPCDAHNQSSDCWSLAYQDLVRHCQRSYRTQFKNATLVLN